MRKYILFFGIVVSIFFLFFIFSNFEDESIYTKLQTNSEKNIEKDGFYSMPKEENHSVMNEEMAVEKMFSYLEEQIDQLNKGFQIQLKNKEQKENKYIMNVYRMVGDLEDLSRSRIGLYSLDKTTGNITPID